MAFPRSGRDQGKRIVEIFRKVPALGCIIGVAVWHEIALLCVRDRRIPNCTGLRWRIYINKWCATGQRALTWHPEKCTMKGGFSSHGLSKSLHLQQHWVSKVLEPNFVLASSRHHIGSAEEEHNLRKLFPSANIQWGLHSMRCLAFNIVKPLWVWCLLVGSGSSKRRQKSEQMQKDTKNPYSATQMLLFTHSHRSTSRLGSKCKAWI